MTLAVLFDLDGTLADTAPDLGLALNRLLQEEGRAMVSDALIRPVASHGARGLIGLGFGLGPEHDDFLRLRTRFLDLYAECFCETTTWFDGVPELLLGLQQRGLHWGIVTNKPSRFTDPLLAALPLPVAPGVVVSGDTVGVAKPDPKPMHHAATQLRVPASLCLYVGDAARDIEAGQRAGMKTVLAAYGYISATDQPQTWGADLSISHPLDLLALLPE